MSIFSLNKKTQKSIHNPLMSESQHASCLLALEPRIMYDAAGLVTAVDGVDDASQTESPVQDIPAKTETFQDEVSDIQAVFKEYVPPIHQTFKEIVFVDPSVNNYQQLIQGVSSDARIIVLNSEQDGLTQITNALADYTDIDAIHIVSHGGPASLKFSQENLSLENMDAHADQLQAWQDSLSADADIMIYGCDVAAGEDGELFVQKLSELTDADVAASIDATGSSEHNGDWDLEHKEGVVEADLLGDVSQFHGVLTTAPVVTAGGTLNYTENDGPSIIDPGITVTDDGATLDSATIQITANYSEFEEELRFTDTGSISGSWDPVAATLTLTGTDTVANYQAALRSVEYINHSENPFSSSRTVEFVADDGVDSLSTPVTATINVTSVNDAPIVKNTAPFSLPPLVGDVSTSPAYSLFDFYTLFGDHLIDDPDFNDTLGIAVTEVDNSNGTWQYSTDGGTTWNDFDDNLSDTNATVLQGFQELNGKVLNSTDLAAGDVQINGVDIGAVTLTGASNNGINMQSAFNLANAINAISGSTNVIAELDNLYSGAAATQNSVSAETISFDINGVHVSVGIPASSTAFDVAQLIADEIRAAASQIDLHAWVGNGSNGGSGDSVIIESFGNINISNLFESGVATSGLANGTYSTDATHNRGEIFLISTQGSYSITTSAGDDSILNLLGMDGGVTTTKVTGDAPSDGFINVNFPHNKIRYVPTSDFSHIPSITFRAWDQTDGWANGTTGVNASINGGSSAFSAGVKTIEIPVENSSPPPLPQDTPQQIAEETAEKLDIATVEDSDSEGDVIILQKPPPPEDTETGPDEKFSDLAKKLSPLLDFGDESLLFELPPEDLVSEEGVEPEQELAEEETEEVAEEEQLAEEEPVEEEVAEEQAAAVAPAEGAVALGVAPSVEVQEAASQKNLTDQLAKEADKAVAEGAEIRQIFEDVYKLLQNCK